MADESEQTTESTLLDHFRAVGVSVTPQAMTALVHAIGASPAETAGDSDSLLLGLLLSGSYTVDAIELAGVNPSLLRDRAKQSLNLPTSQGDWRTTFFDLSRTSTSLLAYAKESGALETADILKYSITPDEVGTGFLTDENAAQDGSIGAALHSIILNRLLDAYVSFVRPDLLFPDKHFFERRLALSYDEAVRLIDASEIPAPEYVERALNAWFVHRRILTDSLEELSRFLSPDIEFDFGFGAGLFMSSGGDYQRLHSGLTMAQRLNPERDAAAIVLCLRDDRIVAGQYTYRNSLVVETPGRSTEPWERLGVQALRPVPLIAQHVMSAFEDLLSSQSLQESDIQVFLNRHPEILLSFGAYTGIMPHVTLSESGQRDLIPDYLLELPATRGFDIVDLKRPNVKLTAGKAYKRISHELQKAVAQLRAYKQYFTRSENRSRFHSSHGLEPFEPEVVVIIGRSSEFINLDERREIEAQLKDTRLVTYDDLIAYGRTRTLDLGIPRQIG